MPRAISIVCAGALLAIASPGCLDFSRFGECGPSSRSNAYCNPGTSDASRADGAPDAEVVRPASVFISPDGNDASACTREAPCRAFERAYRVAQAGQVVEVVAGEYPEQRIQSDGRSPTSEPVLFRPAAGGRASVKGLLEIRAIRIELSDLSVERIGIGSPADGVVLRRLDISTFSVSGGKNISFLGGDVGPSVNSQPIIGVTDQDPRPENVVIDGAVFHDHSQTGEYNTECLQVGGVLGLTVRKSVFRDCSNSASLLVTRFKPDVPSENVVIENNFFYENFRGTPKEPPANILTSREPGLVIRYNSFAGSTNMSIIVTEDGPAAPGTPRIVGNAMLMPIYSNQSVHQCDTGVVYRHNVFPSLYGAAGDMCDSTDLNSAPGFVSPTDLHLRPGAAAVDRGDPSDRPDTDIDGTPRPKGKAPDCGAHEAE